MFLANDVLSGDFVFKIRFQSTSGRGESTPTVVTYEEDPNNPDNDTTPEPEPETEEEPTVTEEPDPVVEETEGETGQEVIGDNDPDGGNQEVIGDIDPDDGE